MAQPGIRSRLPLENAFSIDEEASAGTTIEVLHYKRRRGLSLAGAARSQRLLKHGRSLRGRRSGDAVDQIFVAVARTKTIRPNASPEIRQLRVQSRRLRAGMLARAPLGKPLLHR